MFTVILSNRASRKIKKLPQPYLSRIKELLITLRENPIPTTTFDVAKMKGTKDTFRIRIGDIRIIYSVSWNDRSVYVLIIDWRERSYE
ncbi:MAG: type II toxin-antitoxin system RelE family toxin [Nitrososphaerales archaeon]